MTTEPIPQLPPHNLGLFRLDGFSGYRQELLTLHEWLTSSHIMPTIAISGEQGYGKSTLATAAAWNHLRHFTDGIIRVSAAGATPFRLYDIVRTMDAIFGTELTRASEERWGIRILEQLYRRKRLLIVDKLAGATTEESIMLVNIIGHLNETGGSSRILLIDRNFSPFIAELVRHQHIHLTGLAAIDLPQFIRKRAPARVQEDALAHVDEIHALTAGSPLSLRLVMGLLLDFPWAELQGLLQQICDERGLVRAHNLAAFAVENFAIFNPQVGPLLERLVSAAGGASLTALRELFWADLGTPTELDQTLAALAGRGLLELDPFHQRVLMHPVIRAYLEQSSLMLGEEWERIHAHYYANLAQQYLSFPLERWSEVDVEWGNIYRGADWCYQRVRRLWRQEPLDLLKERQFSEAILTLPETTEPSYATLGQDHVIEEDLRLTRDYGLALAHYAFWRHPPGIAEWLAMGAVAALALADMRDYAWFQMNMGRQLFFAGAVVEAIVWLERAQIIFDQRDLLMELAYVLTDLGTSYRVLNEARKALTYFNAAFDCEAQLGDQQGLATAYMNLGSAYYSLNNFDRALAQQQKALRVALRRHDERMVASVFNNMGLAMEAMERLPEAQRGYEQALELFLRLDDTTGISTCYNNLGSASYARNDYDRALMWYEFDLQLSERRGAWTDMAATLHNLGHVALEQRELARALAYFTQSRDLYSAFQLQEYMQEEEQMIKFIEQMQ
ncbi:MAG: tetratricopeptide repeat protein [Chloroflexi bacterium]|nr:tetratricopeptide repeat protein [Chloroflexota bacterium]